MTKESGTVPKCSLVGMSQKGTGFLNIDWLNRLIHITKLERYAAFDNAFFKLCF